MTLYATDLDGTLLGADARISPRTREEFNRLTAAGAKIAFVTARTPATVEPIAHGLHTAVPSVVMTGAAMWDFAQRRYHRVHYLTPDHARELEAICRRHDVAPFMYTLPRGGNHIDVFHRAAELTPLEDTFVRDRELNDLKSFHLHTPAPEQAYDHTVLFFAMGSPQSIGAVASDMREATGCAAAWYPDTYNPGIALLEAFAPGVSKAEGLKELRELTGAQRVVAFGDNLNDLPMLRAADVAVAVANAAEEVKAEADIVIGPNTADSVIRFIAEDFGR